MTLRPFYQTIFKKKSGTPTSGSDSRFVFFLVVIKNEHKNYIKISVPIIGPSATFLGTTFGTTETILLLSYSFSKPANAAIFRFFRFFRFCETSTSGFRFSSPPPSKSPVIRAFIVSRETITEQLWNNFQKSLFLLSTFTCGKCGKSPHFKGTFSPRFCLKIAGKVKDICIYTYILK